MQIKLKAERVYGHDLYYPACNRSKILANMLNSVTISDVWFDSIEKLGFTIWIDMEWLRMTKNRLVSINLMERKKESKSDNYTDKTIKIKELIRFNNINSIKGTKIIIWWRLYIWNAIIVII